jgi:Tol biopolymer transport system component
VEAPPGLYNQVEISPDGKRAAVVRDDPPLGDIWILELERGGATRLTNGNGRNTRPVWSPDGKRIAFVSDRSGQTEIYIKDADGNTPEQLALGSQLQFIDLTSWSPDGKYLVFSAIDRDTQQDLWLLPLDGDRKPIPYLRTQYVEIGAAVSPDGKYLAYASNETGRLEIFVQTFPKAGDKYQVSNGSAISATWLPGNRIAYVKPSLQEVMVADIIPGATFRTGPARHLTTLPPDVLSGAPLPDISKILVSIPADRHPAVTLTVVLNWTAALRPNP